MARSVTRALSRARDVRRAGPLLATAALLLAAAGGGARAGGVLDRVRATRTIHCGAVERPGLLDMAGGPRGLFVDLCRAIAVAAAGPGANVEVHAYDSDLAFDRIRDGADDLGFLSGSEIVEQRLAGGTLPGPTVFVEQVSVMVAGASPIREPADLAGQTVCFEQGGNGHRALEAFAAAHRLDIIRMGYQEPDEMHDAFDAQACHAMVGEATTLADVRRRGGAAGRGARILEAPLLRFPILAVSGVEDAAWSALVGWGVATLMDADRPSVPWQSAGLASLPLGADGRPAEWQTRMLATSGSYATMRDDNLGRGSALGLAPADDPPIPSGGLPLPPFTE